MKNIRVLPTDKPSRLFIYNGDLGFAKGFQYGSDAILNQQIYITSDEEIKDVDWVVKISSLYKCGGSIEKYSFIDKQFEDITFKKIILTTDVDLIKDGVQAIDDEFLEWFVKNPSCEYVEVESFCKNGDNCPSKGAYDKQYLCDVGYKIIISKEELLLQSSIDGEPIWGEAIKQDAIDTLEYGLLQHIKMCLECNNESQAIRLLEKYGFEKQEELYDEKEVELIANEMVNWAIDNVGNPNPQSGRKFDEVIAKFKNK